MELRVFTCECGHKLRFGAAKCGKCYHSTGLLNRIPFWFFSGALLTFVAGMLLLRG